MNVRSQPALTGTLDSFARLFLDAAGKSRSDLMVTTCQEIQASFTSASSGSDPEASFTSRKRLFRSGLDAWLESLTALAEEYAQTLKGIVVSHPELVEADKDPPQWVRSQLERLLEKALGHELSAEALAGPVKTPGPTRRSLLTSLGFGMCATVCRTLTPSQVPAGLSLGAPPPGAGES